MQVLRDRVVLFSRVVCCTNFFTRFRGLMFHPGIGPDEAYLFDHTNSIHSFSMRFKFDAVFMDSDGGILSVHEAIKPWKVIPPVRGAFWCLEMAEGSISRLELRVGQALSWS